MRFAIIISIMLLFIPKQASGTVGFHLEAMEITGEAQYGPSFENTRPLTNGDLIPHGYSIVVPTNSSVDLSFDPEWKNILRVVGPASLIVHSVFPTEIQMDFGDIYSLLPSLPLATSHEIRTPVSVATVHGSEYRVTHRDATTTVSNFSASPVFVFRRNSELELFKDVFVLKDNRIVRITGLQSPQPEDFLMNKSELASGLQLRASIRQQVQKTVESGRMGKTESLKTPAKER